MLGGRQPIAVEQLPVVIGRSPSSGICIEDRFASRRHCELTVDDGTLLVRDLGSTHGIVVNGSSVTEARLKPGDRLSIGLATFVVDYERCDDNTRAANVSER